MDHRSAIRNLFGDPDEARERFRALTAEERTHLMSQLVEQVPVGIAFARAGDGIVLANPAIVRMFGYGSETEFRAAGWAFLSFDDNARRQVREALYRDGVWEGEAIGTRKDGSRFPIDLTLGRVLDAGGQPAGEVGTVVDTSERRKAEAALQTAHTRLRMLSRRLLSIQESERRALAHELHDELGGTLSAVKIALDTAAKGTDPVLAQQQCARCVALIERALDTTRALSLNLHPPVLDNLGLLPALRWLADQQFQLAGLRVQVGAASALGPLDPDTETTCFRIVQEALNNVVRHASATTVSVTLTRDDQLVRVRIRDDGRGFDVEAARRYATEGASMGLLGMEERASLAGGGVEWNSAIGKGTEVSLWLPVTPKAGGTGAAPHLPPATGQPGGPS